MPTSGFQENLVHSPLSVNRPYAYRSGCGIIPSGEYSVFFDDFYLSPSTNALPGTTAVIDTSATITAAETDAISYNGAIVITGISTTEGAALYWPKGIQLGLGKKFFMETRVYTIDADDTDVQFGLSDVTASTNPEDLWLTAAANVISFGVIDGDATVKMLCDKDNAGTSASTGDVDLSDTTWHVLAIEVGGTAAAGNMWCKGYVDGQLAETWGTETSIPDDIALAPFLGARCGSSTSNLVYFDYLRWSLER